MERSLLALSLMVFDITPNIVIWGICNYANLHKNKKWQLYKVPVTPRVECVLTGDTESVCVLTGDTESVFVLTGDTESGMCP